MRAQTIALGVAHSAPQDGDGFAGRILTRAGAEVVDLGPSVARTAVRGIRAGVGSFLRVREVRRR